MDYRYLKAFLITAKHKSFSKAANELTIAQSAVSRQVKLLEESLGEELILRSSKTVLLTARGEELFELGSSFDTDISNIFERSSEKVLNIGAIDGLLHYWAPTLLSRYAIRRELGITLKIDIPRVLKEKLIARELDVIFTTENIQSEIITSLKLFDEKHMIISKEEINRAKLADYPWIVFAQNDPLYSLTQKRPKKIITLNSMNAVLELVKNGVGIAVVPEHVIKKSDKLKTSLVRSKDKTHIYLSTLNYKTLPDQLKELMELVKLHVINN